MKSVQSDGMNIFELIYHNKKSFYSLYLKVIVDVLMYFEGWIELNQEVASANRVATLHVFLR